MSDWTPVEAWLKTAKRGDWCIVLVDNFAGDAWDRYFVESGRQARFKAVPAMLRGVCSEGYGDFTRWELPSGSPVDCLRNVTHVQDLPKVPQEVLQ